MLKKAIFFNFIFSCALTATFSSAAHAEPARCSPEHEWNGVRCVTIGAGAAAATASGIYSLKKYSQADSIIANHTQILFQHNDFKSGTSIGNIEGKMSSISDGDDVVITYNLSEKENRERYLLKLREKVNDAKAEARNYRIMADTATHQVKQHIGYDANGNPLYTYRIEPDYSSKRWNLTQEAESLREAAKHEAKIEAIKNGAPVPMTNWEHSIKDIAGTGTKDLALQFVREKIERGGKILVVNRLPVQFVEKSLSLWAAGGAGLLGAVVGAGFAIEEAISGKAARKISNGSSESSETPKIETFGAQ